MAAVTDTSIWLNHEGPVSKKTYISVSKPTSSGIGRSGSSSGG